MYLGKAHSMCHMYRRYKRIEVWNLGIQIKNGIERVCIGLDYLEQYSEI